MAAESRPTRWVFLRGLVRESAHWVEFPERFVAAIPDASVELLDLPGNGRHWRVPSPLSLSAAMEFVRTELQRRPSAAATNAPLMLFSVSLGSMVAIDWILRHPGEIEGAVLVNTSVRTFSPFFHRLHWRIWPAMIRTVLERDAALRERRILELTAALKSPAETDALTRTRVAVHREHPVRAANVLRQLIAAARYAAPQRKPAASILLLCSRGDRLVDPRCTEALAAAWNLHPRLHSSAGHDLPLDDPDWTIGQVRDWLSEQRPARAR